MLVLIDEWKLRILRKMAETKKRHTTTVFTFMIFRKTNHRGFSQSGAVKWMIEKIARLGFVTSGWRWLTMVKCG